MCSTPPHTFNPSGAEAGIFQNLVYTVDADALAPGITKSSSAMVLAVQDKSMA